MLHLVVLLHNIKQNLLFFLFEGLGTCFFLRLRILVTVSMSSTNNKDKIGIQAMGLLANWDKSTIEYELTDDLTGSSTYFIEEDQKRIISHEILRISKHGLEAFIGSRFQTLMQKLDLLLVQEKLKYIDTVKKAITDSKMPVDKEGDNWKNSVLENLGKIKENNILCDHLLNKLYELFKNEKYLPNPKNEKKTHFVYSVNTPPLFNSSLSYKFDKNSKLSKLVTLFYESEENESPDKKLVPITNHQANPYSDECFCFEPDLISKFESLTKAMKIMMSSFVMWSESKKYLHAVDFSDDNPIYVEVASGWSLCVSSSKKSDNSNAKTATAKIDGEEYQARFYNVLTTMVTSAVPEGINNMHGFCLDENTNLKKIQKSCTVKYKNEEKSLSIFFTTKEEMIKKEIHFQAMFHDESQPNGIMKKERSSEFATLTSQINLNIKSLVYDTIFKKQPIKSDQYTYLLKHINKKDQNVESFVGILNKWKHTPGSTAEQKRVHQEKMKKNKILSMAITQAMNLIPIIENGYAVLLGQTLNNMKNTLEDSKDINENSSFECIVHQIDMPAHAMLHHFSKSFRMHLLYSPKSFNILNKMISDFDLESRDTFFKDNGNVDRINLIHYPPHYINKEDMIKKTEGSIEIEFLYPQSPECDKTEYLKSMLKSTLYQADMRAPNMQATQV